MGAGASSGATGDHPFATEAEALEAGKTEEEIEAYKASLADDAGGVLNAASPRQNEEAAAADGLSFVDPETGVTHTLGEVAGNGITEAAVEGGEDDEAEEQPDCWERVLKEGEAMYYYNWATGKTAWELPPGVTLPDEAGKTLEGGGASPTVTW